MTRRVIVMLGLLVAASSAAADVAKYHGTVTVPASPGRGPKTSYDVDLQLEYWPGALGWLVSGETKTETSCPPGLHHTCTSRLTCSFSAAFGIEDLTVTLKSGGKLLSTVQTSYPIETVTHAQAPIGKVCTAPYPTVAAQGGGRALEIYLKVSETLRIHLVLEPRAMLGPKSAPVSGYELSGVEIPLYGNYGTASLELGLESRPDLIHRWNGAGYGGRLVVQRVK